MKKIYPALCVIIALATSCSSPKGETTALNLNGGKAVTVDSIATSCLLAPAAMAIIDDELFIANFRYDTIFYVFETPSLKYERNGGVVGPGSEELSSGGSLALSTQKFKGHFLSMLDNAGQGVNIIAPNELNLISHETLYIPADWYYIQNYRFLPDGRQLLQCGQLPMGWGIVNKNCWIETAIEPQLPDDVTAWASDDMNKMFARSAQCAVSEKNNSLAIVANCLPIIDFYDFDGNHKRRVIGEYTLGERLAKTAIYIQPTEDLLYVNYHDPADTNNTHSTIAVFDWDGNQIETYQVGIMVTTFAVDEANKKIYFTTDGDNDNLYWFDI